MKHVHNSILVADDNEMNRDMLSRRLEKQGYTVATANNGQDALDLMEVETFDLLLLDIMMPVMDGFGVLEIMRADEKLKAVPVIVLTSESGSSNVIRCIELGASDYLVKPFDMVVLRNRIVRSLLNKRFREDIDGDLDWSQHSIPDVLIVEDDLLSRELLCKRVSRAGYNVSSVEDGLAAIEALKVKPVDLVLLDIMMPGMNGFDVLEYIKKDEVLKHMSVIMISALDDKSNIDKCLQMGAEDYITKPFNALILKSRILSCLQTKRILDKDNAR